MKFLAPLLLLVFACETSAQTLADVARKERARQKQFQSLNKGTYTNATARAAEPLKPAEGTPADAAATPEKKEEAPAPSQPTGPVDNQGRDEKFWREAFQKARDELRRAQEKAELTEARLKELNVQLLRQSDIYNREGVLGPQITATQKELDTAKAEIEQATNKISNLEDSLRAAGGQPGWAR